jgi:hypothetical protein
MLDGRPPPLKNPPIPRKQSAANSEAGTKKPLVKTELARPPKELDANG